MPYADKEKGRATKKRYNKVYKAQYYAKNKERLRIYNKERYAATKEQVTKDKREKYRDCPGPFLIAAAKWRSKANGHDFNLDAGDAIIGETCPVFNKPFIVGHRDWGPSIDRIDPRKGYVKGNVAIICFRANRLKANATLEELEQLVNYIKNSQREENQSDSPPPQE